MDVIIEMMKRADFRYEYTDDMNVYRRGVAEQQRIMMALREVPLGFAMRMIRMYVPPELTTEFLVSLFVFCTGKITRDS